MRLRDFLVKIYRTGGCVLHSATVAQLEFVYVYFIVVFGASKMQSSIVSSDMDPVSLLCNESQQRGLAAPGFVLASINNTVNPPIYTWSCHWMGHTVIESGRSRREARNRAAMALMAIFPYESLPSRSCRSSRRLAMRQTR